MTKKDLTHVTLREYLEALRRADLRALDLAQDAQAYKDSKANELREQINSERGDYATQDQLRGQGDRLEILIAGVSARFEPMVEFMAAQNARAGTVAETAGIAARATNNRLIAMGVVISVIVVVVNIVFFVLSGH